MLIPDFVSKMTPEIEENVIDLGSNARLSVTYGIKDRNWVIVHLT